MKDSLRHQFERLALRLNELDATLADPKVASDMKRFRALTREQAEVSGLVERFRRFEQRERDGADATQMLAESTGAPDMAEMARQEIAEARADVDRLHDELQLALLPRDPDDARNAFVEIRAGTGGDESALFAADLARMYLRHCERRGWRSEVMSESVSDLGGYKEVVFRIEGDDVYARLKFESGGHRVQRVPTTETQGRIHTSACTVAVLPEPDEAEEVKLNPADLRIDTFRASGAGGQHINKTDSAIRITHLPTGLVAECQDDRSQHRNKAKAMAVLTARLRDKDRNERAAKEAATRKGLIGSGDRSDRIRTYNFPQGRFTDHRINLTLYKLQFILDGDLEEVTAALQAAQAAEQLAAPRERGAVTTVAEALSQARVAGIDRLDAHLLLGRVLGQTRTWLLAHDDATLAPDQAEAFRAALARRAGGEPLAYILGEKEFHGLLLEVDSSVLVPRPDTEVLVDWALELLRGPLRLERPRVVDLGTGSGAIALAVKHSQSDADVVATDASPAALAVARGNSERLGLPIVLAHGSWWAAVGEARFDLVLSNPPYIAGDDRHLEALMHEPQAALTPGGDGLGSLRAIVAGAVPHLAPGGWLLLEHGHDQHRAVQSLLRDAGFAAVQTRLDLAGVPRCTAGHV